MEVSFTSQQKIPFQIKGNDIELHLFSSAISRQFI